VRLLMPQRFDVLGRSMDTNIVTQWLALEAACDLVLWGPGLDGFVPGMPLDEAADYVDADVVLLPDLHHAIPWLWTDLWAGIERSNRPVVWHLVDQGSEISKRRAVWERIQPAAVLINYSERDLTTYGYDDLRERYGTDVLYVPCGFDGIEFHAPAADAERDIDLLISGAQNPYEAYPMRNRIKQAARTLAGEFRVLEVGHPGYWETTGVVEGRGQAQYGDLLRRSRLATTGTGYSGITRKYWEAAACGAIGVGDLPRDQPERPRFVGSSLEVDPSWSDERIAEEMRRLLTDRDRCQALSRAGMEAVRGCDHRERAHDYVEALATVALDRNRVRRPRPFPSSAPARKICAAAEPTAVPGVRPNWVDVWTVGSSGASRTRRVEAALAGDQDVVVIAFDPDATLDVDALILATACRATGRVVVRPGHDTRGDVFAADWSAVAAPRAALQQAVTAERGRAGLEAALIALGQAQGWQVLPGGAYTDPASALLRLTVHPSPSGTDRAVNGALAQHRFTTAAELFGLRSVNGWGIEPPVVGAHPEAPTPAQDPECELLEGGAFARFDAREPRTVEAIAAHARLGAAAPPLHIGIPLSAGLSVTDALAVLGSVLETQGVDPSGGPDLVILERPLFEVEIAWLATNLRSAEDVLREWSRAAA